MKKKIIILTDRKFRKTDFTGLSYSYLRAFEKRGFECDLVSLNINPYLYYIINKYYPKKLNNYLKLKQKSIIEYIKRLDKTLVFVVKGYYLLPETIEEIKSFKKMIVCFNPDDPFSPIIGSSSNCIKASIPFFDQYFIWTKSLIEPIKKAGCKNVHYLPFASDSDLLNPAKLSTEINIPDMKCDVSFVGNADKERIEFIVSLSNSLDGSLNKFIYGSRWANINGFKVNGNVDGIYFINAICSSKINLNILRLQNKNSNNMRTFEIPAIGGFMLHEYSEEAMEFFKPEVEADYFKSPDECADKIKYYLKNEELRKKIAKAGHGKIFTARHLYTDRVDEFWEKVATLM